MTHWKQVAKTTRSVPNSMVLPLKHRMGGCSLNASLLTRSPTSSTATTTTTTFAQLSAAGSFHRGLAIRSISFKNMFSKPEPEAEKKTILDQDNLFHPLSKSPIAELRDRASIINKYGVCPVCDTQGPDHHKHPPTYECPDCGYPTHCSEDHYHEGKDAHQHICGILREQNEDDHDLRSGRTMKEFEFPSSQGFDETVNMGNWDMYFYTRGFPSMDSGRSMRHVSKLLTYPITVASILHESCPYTFGKEITVEGMRSLSALRTILYPRNEVIKNGVNLIRTDMINIYVVGARAEATLPPHIWLQLAYLFPRSPFHIHFVGPDCLPPNKAPYTTSLNERVMFTYDNSYYHDYHEKIEKFDPYTDLFFLFSPGIGHDTAREGWKPTIQKALETKCPIFLTGFDEHDMGTDIEAVEQDYSGEFDWIMQPTQNEFRSLKRDVNLMDLRQTIFANWGIWGIRGKRYDVTHNPEEDD